MITYSKHRYEGVEAHVALFAPETATGEAHVMLRVTDTRLTAEHQFKALTEACAAISHDMPDSLKPVFARLFVSDAANQMGLAQTVREHLACPLSIVEQPPLDGSKAAMWVWLMGDSNYRHIFTTNISSIGEDSYKQTADILETYAAQLAADGLSLTNDCVRTWFFVNDIDNNYGGLVKARNEVFERHGLTADTHFIASTGIGGRTANHRNAVQMDAYSVSGLKPQQVRYLYAASHLSPTAQYGVAFERGVMISYDDRRHVFISGTASIDNNGQILYQGDILRQTERMIENVSALLTEAGATWADVPSIIIYLRDTADRNIVDHYFEEHLPTVPRVLLMARVCRPGWLIEMECMAMTLN